MVAGYFMLIMHRYSLSSSHHVANPVFALLASKEIFLPAIFCNIFVSSSSSSSSSSTQEKEKRWLTCLHNKVCH